MKQPYNIPAFKRGEDILFTLEYDLSDEPIVKTFVGVSVKAGMRLQKETLVRAWFECRVDAGRRQIHYRLSGEETARLPVGYYVMDTRFQTASGLVDFSDDVLIRLLRETTYA